MSSVVMDTSPATVTTPFAKVIRSVSSVCPMVAPFISTSSISSEPPDIKPVVVIVDEPVSIVPKPDVIEPLSNAPTVVAAVVTRFGIAVISSSKYAAKSVTATCFIVPSSLNTTRSASTTVVDEAVVSPSIIFNSAAVDVTPSRMFNSAVVEVTPSRMFNSAVVEVTPSRMFNSAVVTVAPSNISSSASLIPALPIVRVPDTSKLPLISINVALISTSSVALISRVVAFGAPMFCDESLN